MSEQFYSGTQYLVTSLSSETENTQTFSYVLQGIVCNICGRTSSELVLAMAVDKLNIVNLHQLESQNLHRDQKKTERFPFPPFR